MCIFNFSLYQDYVFAGDSSVITNNDLSFATYEYCLKVLQKNFHILRVFEICANTFNGQFDVFGKSFASLCVLVSPFCIYIVFCVSVFFLALWL